MSDEPTANAELEGRYRRLLALYPRAHRAEYEEEMLGVLLNGASIGQRHPAPAEAFNLVRSALWMRFARGVPGVSDPRWIAASAMLGLLGALAAVAHLVGDRVARIAENLIIYADENTFGFPVAAAAWVTPLAWLVIATAAALRWWIVAAAVASATVLVEAVEVGRLYHEDPVSVLQHIPMLTLAVTIAVALTVAAARRGRARVERRPTVAFGVSIVVAGLAPVLDPLTTRVHRFGDMYVTDMWPGGGGYLPGVFSGPAGPAGLARLLTYLLAGIIAVVAYRRTEPGIRRRLLVLLGPAVSLAVIIELGFGGFIASSPRFDPPVLLAPEQWVVLGVVPVIALLGGAAWVRRHERRLHLIRLGELAERQPREAEPA